MLVERMMSSDAALRQQNYRELQSDLSLLI